MGYVIQFDNGREVEFDREPTQKDIEEVARSFTTAQTTQPQGNGKNFFQREATGFSKSIVGGAAGLGSLVQGLGQRVMAAVTPGKSYDDIRKETGIKRLDPTTKEGQALRKNTQPVDGERLGFFAGEVAQFAVPGTKVANATKGLSFLPRIATRAAGDAAVAYGKTGGDAKEALTTGAISAGFQGGAEAAGLAARYLGSLLKGGAATVTGRGSSAVGEVLKNPKAAREGMRGVPSEGLKKDAQQIVTYVNEFRKGSSQNYQRALEQLSLRGTTEQGLVEAAKKQVLDNARFQLQNGGITQQVFNQVDDALKSSYNTLDDLSAGISKTGAPTGVMNTLQGHVQNMRQYATETTGKGANLSLDGVKERWMTSLKKLGVEINPKTKELNFLETTLPSSYTSKLEEIGKIFDTWTDTSPAGLNKLAVKIGNFAVKGETGSDRLFNSVVSTMKNGIRNYVGKEVPEVAKMNARYASEQQFLKELQTYLGKMTKTNDPAQFKIVTQRLGTLFTKNKEIAREVLEKIPGGADIVGRQAGREFAETIPRSGASIGDLTRSLIQTAIPPKFIGEVAAVTGIAQQKIAPLMRSLGKLGPTERAVVISLFSSLLNQAPQAGDGTQNQPPGSL